jgi:hypothetical protein
MLALVDLLTTKNAKTYLQSDERKHKSLQGHQDNLAVVKNSIGTAPCQTMPKPLEDVESILLKKKRGGGKRS